MTAIRSEGKILSFIHDFAFQLRFVRAKSCIGCTISPLRHALSANRTGNTPAHFIKDQDQPAPLVECRGSLTRTDQTISELCTGVLPNKQRLLNGGLVLEVQIHGAKKTGKRIEDLTRDSLAQNSES